MYSKQRNNKFFGLYCLLRGYFSQLTMLQKQLFKRKAEQAVDATLVSAAPETFAVPSVEPL